MRLAGRYAGAMLGLLAAVSLMACSVRAPAPPPGELYLAPVARPAPPPSTDNDPNGGAD